MPIHIFWDNSNMWGAAQDLRKLREPNVPWVALRLYFKNLYRIVVNNRQAVTKILSGSVPPECEELWTYAREIGFETDLLRRVDTEDGQKEQAVDEVLHMKMANTILDHDPPQTMVLLSGDSRRSSYGTSFPDQIARALRKDWEVEIYSSSMSISRRIYDPLVSRFPGKIKIVELDPYYECITFVKGGEYYMYDEQKNKIFFTIPSRIVSSV
jgi:hypothetical protein